jgi:hypothetical protein
LREQRITRVSCAGRFLGRAIRLGAMVRASVDHAALGKALNLRPEQRITLAQSVGYAKKPAN